MHTHTHTHPKIHVPYYSKLFSFVSQVIAGLMGCVFHPNSFHHCWLFSFLLSLAHKTKTFSLFPKAYSTKVRCRSFSQVFCSLLISDEDITVCSHLDQSRRWFTLTRRRQIVKVFRSPLCFRCQTSCLPALNLLCEHHHSDPRWTAQPRAVRGEGYASDSQRKSR